jgi:hypothetical protein
MEDEVKAIPEAALYQLRNHQAYHAWVLQQPPGAPTSYAEWQGGQPQAETCARYRRMRR